MSKLYKTILDDFDLDEALDHIKAHSIIAFDTETTGLNPRKNIIVGFSFTGKVGEGFYFPLFKWVGGKSGTLKPIWKKEEGKTLLKLLATKKLIMHNGSFDIRMCRADFNIDLAPSLYVDTILLKHTVEEEQPFGLKEIAILKKHELGLSGIIANQEQLDLKESALKNGATWKKDEKEMFKADLEIMSPYACADADLTLRIYNYYLPKLKEENLEKFFFEDEVMPLYREVTIDMEDNGIKLDIDLIQKTESEITVDMQALEDEFQDSIKLHTSELEIELLNKKVPIIKGGNFGQAVAEFYNLDLPRTKAGKISLSTPALNKLPKCEGVEFLLTGLCQSVQQRSDFDKIQRKLYLEKTGQRYIVNIQSKTQLKQLFFDTLKEKPLSKTDKGAPQFNEDMVEHLSFKYPGAKVLQVYNKLQKIKSSYIDRFLRQEDDGYFYPTFKQFGTISGRYGSDLQQLNKPIEEQDKDDYHPLIYKYNNLVREFFICKEGNKFIDNDYNMLEIMVFSNDAADKSLISLCENNYDVYSQVAIEVYNLHEKYSADKKSPNFLKKHEPALRSFMKGPALGIRYGMRAFKLAYELQMSQKEAQDTILHFCNNDPFDYEEACEKELKRINSRASNPKFKGKSLSHQDYQVLAAQFIIDVYFTKFPGLKQAMDKYINQAFTEGRITQIFGRVRHIPEAKQLYSKYGKDLLDWINYGKLAKRFGEDKKDIKAKRKRLNNLLNNSLNFPIQSAAASIVNRASIAINRAFRAEGIDGKVIAQIHDQLICEVSEKDVDKAMKIVQDKMENTTKLEHVTLKAPPAVGKNFRDAH